MKKVIRIEISYPDCDSLNINAADLMVIQNNVLNQCGIVENVAEGRYEIDAKIINSIDKEELVESTLELLDRLPSLIKKPNKNPIDEWDNEIYYYFNLSKDEGVYELSYCSFLMDSELISFSGSLDEVVKNMIVYINNLEE